MCLAWLTNRHMFAYKLFIKNDTRQHGWTSTSRGIITWRHCLHENGLLTKPMMGQNNVLWRGRCSDNSLKTSKKSFVCCNYTAFPSEIFFSFFFGTLVKGKFLCAWRTLCHVDDPFLCARQIIALRRCHILLTNKPCQKSPHRTQDVTLLSLLPPPHTMLPKRRASPHRLQFQPKSPCLSIFYFCCQKIHLANEAHPWHNFKEHLYSPSFSSTSSSLLLYMYPASFRLQFVCLFVCWLIFFLSNPE